MPPDNTQNNLPPKPKQNIFSPPSPAPANQPEKPAAPLPNPYEFIMNPANQPKKAAVNLSSLSSKQRILVIVGGGVFLLIILVFFYSTVLHKKPNVTNEVSLAQQQYQLISISTQAGYKSAQQPTKNLAVSVQFSLTTDQAALLNYLAQHGSKVSTKELALGVSSSITQRLSDAAAASDYDVVYVQIVQNALSKYVQSLAQTLSVTPGATERQLLRASSSAATLLQTQANTTAQTLLGS